MESGEDGEHRGAIGAESKVMERTCRATKKRWRLKREEL